jgi:hypothetical protein
MEHSTYLLYKFIYILLGARQTKAAFTAKPDPPNVTTTMSTTVFTIPIALFAAAKHLAHRLFILRRVVFNMSLLE